jgi:signal transduction histidine kinase/ActR/RegA family two-component response regulator
VQPDFRGLVDAATDVIAVFDRDRRYVYINAAQERVTGVPGASLLGKRNDEVMLPDDALVWTEALDDVSRSGRQRAIEATLMTPHGPRRFASVLTVVSDGLVCAVSRDITEIGRGYDEVDLEMLTELARRTGLALDNARLLAAEQEARRHAEEARDRTRRLQRLTAALSGAVDERDVVSIMVDAGRDALGASAGLAWLLRGGDTLEVAASTYGDRPGQLERYRTIPMTTQIPVCDVTRSGQPMMFENHAALAERYPEVRLTDPPPFQAWAVIPFVVAGRGAGSVAFAFLEERRFHDDDRELLTAMAGQASLALERARLYDALQTTAQQLATANQRKDEFLAMLGHELRNPLAPIATALDVMEIRDPDAMHEERAVIRRQVDHLSRLIGDLLDVSRITRGKVQLAREVLELGAVLAAAIEMASPMLERRMQPLTVDVPRNGVLVDADPTRLAQVFHNLLLNAAKYSEPRSQVTVRAQADRERIVVDVIDQGMGISPDLLPRLFDLFVQGERALDRSQGGLGIGLTIARSLCELHGGTIAAASAGPGQGSTFTVTLPRAARAEPRPPAPAAPPAATSQPGKRVLVVDDNVDAAQMLHELLAQLGHEAAVAHDGAAALLVAGAFQPDVAVLDIGLPAMDGYELARRLRAQRGASALRLIAVTGYGQDADRMRAQAAGFDHHLIKPIAADALVALLAAEPPALREG